MASGLERPSEPMYEVLARVGPQERWATASPVDSVSVMR